MRRRTFLRLNASRGKRKGPLPRLCRSGKSRVPSQWRHGGHPADHQILPPSCGRRAMGTSAKRYERQGILADPQAILRAQSECEADAGARARRRAVAATAREAQDVEFIRDFATAVRAAFPHCPAGEEEVIARHACRKYSGRVGRSAAAKELAPEAIRLAVIAHIRHVHTEYDRLLGMTGDRQLARHQIRDQVQTVLGKWE